MTKKMLSLMLALVLCLGLPLPASAAQAPEGTSAIQVQAGGMTQVVQNLDLCQEENGVAGETQTIRGFNQIAGGTPITVTNAGADASAVFYIYYIGYTLRAEGKYFNSGDIRYLADHSAAGVPSSSASNGLYWVFNSGKLDGAAAAAQAKTLVPGESVSFTLPDEGTDTIFRLCIEIYYPEQNDYYGRSLPLKIAAPRPAKPTPSTVMVNGVNTAFDAYNIDGSNYFKLRDLAYVLNGTAKQFQVGWDSSANSISLTSGQAYTAVGGEMGSRGTAEQIAAPTASRILLNGREVSLTAYLINGNNYFKLRDIGQAFDFGVDWNSEAQTIFIDTAKGYTPG